MSTPNEEIVRRGIEAYNRGDLESTLGLFHPEVVLHDPGRTGRSYHGHDGLMYRITEGKVVELRIYADRAPALDSMNG